MGGGQTTELFTQPLTQHLEVRTRSGLGTKGLELRLAAIRSLECSLQIEIKFCHFAFGPKASVESIQRKWLYLGIMVLASVK